MFHKKTTSRNLPRTPRGGEGAPGPQNLPEALSSNPECLGRPKDPEILSFRFVLLGVIVVFAWFSIGFRVCVPMGSSCSQQLHRTRAYTGISGHARAYRDIPDYTLRVHLGIPGYVVNPRVYPVAPAYALVVPGIPEHTWVYRVHPSILGDARVHPGNDQRCGRVYPGPGYIFAPCAFRGGANKKG